MTKEQYIDAFLDGFYCSGEGDNGEWNRRKPGELEQEAGCQWANSKYATNSANGAPTTSGNGSPPDNAPVEPDSTSLHPQAFDLP